MKSVAQLGVTVTDNDDDTLRGCMVGWLAMRANLCARTARAVGMLVERATPDELTRLTAVVAALEQMVSDMQQKRISSDIGGGE